MEYPKGLKITRVESMVLRLESVRPGKEWSTAHVRVETEEGFVGWGEVGLRFTAPACAAIDAFGAQMIGMSVWDCRSWLFGGSAHRTVGGTLGVDQPPVHGYAEYAQGARSAIDMALWDIVGKKLEMPVHALLGGKLYDRIRVYQHPFYLNPDFGDPESYNAFTKDLVKQGIVAGKLDPFQTTMRPDSYGSDRELSKEQKRHATEIVRAIREGGGPDFTLMIECHARFNVATGVRIVESMKPFNPYWVEEPVPSRNTDALREVQRATSIPIATGETIIETESYVPILTGHACRVLQPDIGRIGGITNLKKVADMASNFYVNVAPHAPFGPVMVMASVHVDATTPNFLIQETPLGTLKTLFAELIPGYEYDPQYLNVPNTPGLGLEISDDFVRYRKVVNQ